MSQRLILVGASARAAAFSARLGKYEPWCADLFADSDLQAVATVERIENYPSGVKHLLSSAPQAPWMYTGALENWPDLIDELRQLRPLYGNPGAALRKARNPVFWSRVLAEAGLPAPRVSRSAVELPLDGSWLRKPLRSANGDQVAPWTANRIQRGTQPPRGGEWYYQQRIAGVPIAAVFVAAEGEASILGVTRQLVGGDWRRALSDATTIETSATTTNCDKHLTTSCTSPFRYTGSIGPIVLEEAVHQTLQRVGAVLARSCGLVGLFGIDAILNSANAWPIEINPRYTASIEILERASMLRTRQRRSSVLSSIKLHEAACRLDQLPPALGQSAEIVSAKLIYYAAKDLVFSKAMAHWAVERNLASARPAVADIPAAGTAIRRGQPVVTLFADGLTSQSTLIELERTAQELENLLDKPSHPL